MKARLMHPDRDFDLQPELPAQAQDLTLDLALDTLLGAMAGGDEFLLDVARKALLSGLGNDVATIGYRQAILQDCLRNPQVVRQLYDLAIEAIVGKKKLFFGGIFSKYPSGILHGAIDLMQIYLGKLRRLRGIADKHGHGFASPGFTALFAMLQREFGDDYFARIEDHLTGLKFKPGILVSAELGECNQGVHYVLRRARDPGRNWLARLFRSGAPAYTFRIEDRDEAGAQILSGMRDRSLNEVANALAQSTDHILAFFSLLRAELAFYVGGLNLHERLAALGAPVAFPGPQAAGPRQLRCRGLYDVCLALRMGGRVVGNTLDADGRSLVVVTGANQGGKSTFLRSVGLAQLMMQSGLFVAAESFAGAVCAGLFTHYKREEDVAMEKGKLDEELSRMSAIADRLVPNAIMLFNESFAATNEREGSEIARQIVGALLEKGIRIVFVTHLYEFAHRLHEERSGDALFLRAERSADGTRTFRLVEGEPLATSYAEDLYREVFAVDKNPLLG